jgi:hypothetical protein
MCAIGEINNIPQLLGRSRRTFTSFILWIDEIGLQICLFKNLMNYHVEMNILNGNFILNRYIVSLRYASKSRISLLKQ